MYSGDEAVKEFGERGRQGVLAVISEYRNSFADDFSRF